MARKTGMTAEEERLLHEETAHLDTHEAQTRGVVGWFYRLYIEETLRFVRDNPGRLLDIGSGEGMIFKNSVVSPVQLDVSFTRLTRAAEYNGLLICADAYDLPFKNESFEAVLLIALLEHTTDPGRILKETHRVLKPGGRTAVLIPNDINMSAGRVLLGKWPPRYPDHLTFLTPQRMRALAGEMYEITLTKAMPFNRLGFWLNMYWFAELRKKGG